MADYKVDTDKIKGLGTKFNTFSTDVSSKKSQLDNINPQPGSFTEANDLKTNINDRVSSLKTYIQNLAGAFSEVSTGLSTAANNYHAGEEMNSSEVDKIRTAVDKKLPGFDKTKSTDK